MGGRVTRLHMNVVVIKTFNLTLFTVPLYLNFVYLSEQTHNHEQNTVDKFTKLSKIGVSLECFTADFWQFSSTTVKISLLDGRLGLAIDSSFSGTFLKFRDYLSLFFLSCWVY